MKRTRMVEPGDVVDCIIGQRFDAAWCPKAKVLLLAAEENYYATRFFGVAKQPKGDIEILFHVTLRPEGVISDDHGWGEYYSAFSLNYTNGEVSRTDMARYLPLIETALTYHAAKLKELPAYTEIAGLGKI